MIGELADATGLLVLDGCEARPADAAAEMDAVVATCPGIRMLATSRERLGLIDEALIPVGPLAEAEALELLVDRAKLVDPHFELRPDEVATADRLCGLVDRLPLGLELVARHLHLLRLDELAERVEVDLSRWAGGPTRGRTGLWAALDASVARLGPLERRVMVALAVMVADADAALIAEVIDPADPHLDVFDVIARLVDASLVQVRSADGPTRYELCAPSPSTPWRPATPGWWRSRGGTTWTRSSGEPPRWPGDWPRRIARPRCSSWTARCRISGRCWRPVPRRWSRRQPSVRSTSRWP